MLLWLHKCNSQCRMNPLQKYIDDNGMTQLEFSRRLTALISTSGEKRVWPPQVHNWCAGKTRPRPMARLLIALATKGSVPTDAWDKFDK